MKKWIGSFTESPHSIGELLKCLPSVGIFKKRSELKKDGERDELISLCMYKHMSDIGMTRTVDEHRMKSLAKIATLRLSRQLMNENQNVYVLI